MESCLFCKIISGEITSKTVYEDDEVFAFNDISPQAPVHIIIVPKKHIRSAEEINETNALLAGKLISTASKLAKDLNLKGYRLVFNTNEIAGQTIFHLHCHLLGGRQMNWPPG